MNISNEVYMNIAAEGEEGAGKRHNAFCEYKPVNPRSLFKAGLMHSTAVGERRKEKN